LPSPDIREYVDLTLYDRTPQELLDTALADAAIKLPGWVPREGNTELVLLEAVSLEVAELVYAINRLPGAVTEVLLGLYGIVRDDGAPPVATVRFELSDNLGHTIPAGTIVRLVAGDVVVDFTTNANLAIAPGATEGVIGITADRNTIEGNGTPIDTELELITAVPYVDAVVVTVAIAGGLEAETGESFLDRGAQALRRLVSTLVTPDHFVAAALEDPNVLRAQGLDNYNPAVGPNPGDNPGHITVVVAGANGAALTAPQKAAIEAVLEAAAMANLDVHLADPNVTNQAIDVTVVRLAGYTDLQVQANVTSALQAYLDPATWAWGRDVYRNELISVIDQAVGVDRVVALAVPAADVAITNIGGLVNDGALTITVQAP
jgi:Baseplate J-like protein